MTFDALVDNLDNQCLRAFSIPATHFPDTVAGDDITWGGIPITGIIEDPVIAVDTMPGSLPPGVNTLVFFVRFEDLVVSPKRGDVIVINEVQYTIFDLSVDEGGSAHLTLRQN